MTHMRPYGHPKFSISWGWESEVDTSLQRKKRHSQPIYCAWSIRSGVVLIPCCVGKGMGLAARRFEGIREAGVQIPKINL